MFLFLLDLHEILPLLSKQYLSCFIETVALEQAYENSIPEKWNPGPRTVRWDPKAKPWARTLR